MFLVTTDPVQLPVELGRRLRQRRLAAGRTIASVAADAGLSVPYIANLENGRGNPTIAALAAIARALGAELRVHLDEAVPDPVELPDALVQFAKSQRFKADVVWLSQRSGQPVVQLRDRCLTAMAHTAELTTQPMSDVDCHRLLDAIVLMNSRGHGEGGDAA